MTYRLVQNFSRRRALLISSDERTIATLGTTLGKLGLQVCQLPLVQPVGKFAFTQTELML